MLRGLAPGTSSLDFEVKAGRSNPDGPRWRWPAARFFGSKAVDLWFESEEKRIGEEYLADDNSGPVVIVFWYVTSPSTVYEVRGELLGQ